MPNAVAVDRHPDLETDTQVAIEAESESVAISLGPSRNELSSLLGFVDPADVELHQSDFVTGEAVWVSTRSPFKKTENEDAVASLTLSPQRAVFMVADGLGGHRGGRRASQLVKNRLSKACRALLKSGHRHTLSKLVPLPVSGANGENFVSDPRTMILDEIESVNQRLLRSRTGAATTLSLVEIHGNKVRSYQVGDSEILIVSQRGKVKYSTVAQSPIGYGVEAGLLSEEQALYHPDRHLVSNVIGNEQMTVEIGPWIKLSPKDTLLIASDGLFDNLKRREIIEGIRKGKLEESVKALSLLARRRMILPDDDFPSKPDDLTILAYRPTK